MRTYALLAAAAIAAAPVAASATLIVEESFDYAQPIGTPVGGLGGAANGFSGPWVTPGNDSGLLAAGLSSPNFVSAGLAWQDEGGADTNVRPITTPLFGSDGTY